LVTRGSIQQEREGTLHPSSGTANKTPPPSILPQKRATLLDPVQCWAHSRGGVRCQALVKSREGEPIPIPYCRAHLRAGDGAVRVVKIQGEEKCLVARHDLPKNYRLAFWGQRGKCPTSDKDDRAISFYPPDARTGKNRDENGVLRTHNYNGALNPDKTGDVIQYAACPGPTERQNMRSTFQYWGVRNGQMGGLEFVTLEAIPKNTQLCHWYGNGWWSARDIKRRDVGTNKFPAPKRMKKTPSAAA
jgi:hypothetical protein